MTIIKIGAVAVIGVIGIMLVRSIVPQMAPLIAAAAGLIILGACISEMSGFIGYYYQLCQESGYDEYFKVMLKGLGISLAAQVASDLCRDAGEHSLGSKVEFAAKIEILTVSLPLIKSLVELSEKILLE